MIANAGKDERGKYIGGKAGDQGGEFVVRTFYNRPWDVVLRYPQKKIAAEIAKVAEAAASNDCIGYDQGERLTFYKRLKEANWYPEDIMIPCETDCSASTAACIIAVGYRKNIKKFKELSPSLTTKNMQKALVAAGFTALVDDTYTKSDKFLLAGDILLCTGHHVAINLTTGSGVSNDADFDRVVKDVMAGKYGVGAARRARLIEEGWNPSMVQAEVNRRLKK